MSTKKSTTKPRKSRKVMSIKKSDTKPHRCEKIARRVRKKIEAGDEVILQFDRKVTPKRVLKTINFCVVDTQVKIVIHHAEFREYIKNAATKAKEKVPAVDSTYILTALLTALYTGDPVTLGMMLIATGIVVLAGAVIGAVETLVSSVKIYTYRGETRVRLAPAA